MYLKKQKFLVVGISKSGVAAAEFLLSHGAQRVYIYDDVTGGTIERSVCQLKEKGAIEVSTDSLSQAENESDILVLSPGIPIDHSIPMEFRKMGKKIIGEMELGALYLTSPYIAVTGTNGKTTTVTLLTQILTQSGLTAQSCGNIGTPLCGILDSISKDSMSVLEVSSFQLETTTSLHPHIAMVLNITEDHLSRHYNMQNYIYLKQRLIKNSMESEYVVLNYDDSIVRSFSEHCKAKIVFFSTKEKVEGAYLYGNDIYFLEERVMSCNSIPLVGNHNLENVLACVAACKIMGLENSAIEAGISSFKGIKHRIEMIGEVEGIKYIDDSKGTNVDATKKAVESMKSETVLLLGGKDKGYDYDDLFSYLRNSVVIHTVLYGENRFKLLAAAMRTSYNQITLCPDLNIAVRLATLIAKNGQNVLLSPASSSFDEFTNYEERGEKFVSVVHAIQQEKQNRTLAICDSKQEE